MENLTPIASSKISASRNTLLIYLPQRLVRLLDLRKGEYLEVLADVDNHQAILRKTGFVSDSRRA